jgi:PAS domain S-box-containing protein
VGGKLALSIDGASVSCDCSGGAAGAPGDPTTIVLRLTREADAHREWEDRFRSLMEQAPFSVQLLATDGRTIRVNRAWEELWGLTLEQLSDYNMLEDRQLEEKGILSFIRKAFEGEASHVPLIEYDPNATIPDRTRHRDPKRWVSSVAYPLKDAAGRVREVVIVHEDVTARYRAEQALHESEEKFRLMADTIPQLAWMAGPDGDVFWYNRRWYEYTGTTPQEMQGGGGQRAHDPQVLPTVVERWQESIASGEPFDMVFPLKGADGLFRPFLTRVNPLRGGDGRILYWFGTHTDISEQQQSESASRFLADASATLASVIDYQSTLNKVASLAVPRFADWCAVDMVEPDGSLSRLAVQHVDPEKVRLALELARLYPPDPNVPRGILHVARTGESDMMEEIPEALITRSARDEEHLRLLRALAFKSYICVAMKTRGQVVGVITFVSAESGRPYTRLDLSLAEELASRAAVAVENSRLYAELRDADRRKDEFLATLAHELRNPLAPIRNALAILKMPVADPSVLERSRAMMERQVQHLVRLVDDLLDVSRVMRGRIELRRERLDVATVLGLAVETAQPVIQAQGHELTVSLPPSPIAVDADPVRLTQVVSNLLTNAAKYTARGGHVWLSAERDGEWAVIRVRDTGIGLAPEMLARVFDLFVQVDNSVARSQGGLGIGLTLARSLVEMHGGHISARSDGLGKGTEFAVRLPLASARAADAVSASPTDRLPSVVSSAAPRRILVVDDNVDAAETLAMLLRMGGHTVEVAHDGGTAIRIVSASRPEIAFLDLGMPGMDGYELARCLRADPALAGIRLVALTGWGQEEDRRRSAEAGFDLHVVKPVEPAMLEKVLADPRLR